jgi:hypothetical protein
MDVIELIFDHIDIDASQYHHSCFSRYSKGDRRRKLPSLALLCLVSRDWLIPARRLLYRLIPELGKLHFDKLFRTIKELPDIRKYVQRLYIYIHDSVLEYAELLPNCKIYLLPRRDGSTPSEALAGSKNIAGIHIKDFPWLPEVWSPAFTRWIGLEDLRLYVSSYQPSFPPAETQEYDVWLPSLRTLKLSMMEKWTLPPTTPNTIHTLVIHSFTPRVYAQPFIDFVRRHSSSLRRLLLNNINFDDDEGGEVLDNIGTLAPNLECIFIRSSQCQITEKFFDNIPRSVVEISVEIDAPQSIKKCMDFLKGRNHSEPPLKRLAIRVDVGHIATGPISREDWAEVEKIAAAKGAAFTYHHDRMSAVCYPEWSNL